jgi:hypothetical protein
MIQIAHVRSLNRHMDPEILLACFVLVVLLGAILHLVNRQPTQILVHTCADYSVRSGRGQRVGTKRHGLHRRVRVEASEEEEEDGSDGVLDVYEVEVDTDDDDEDGEGSEDDDEDGEGSENSEEDVAKKTKKDNGDSKEGGAGNEKKEETSENDCCSCGVHIEGPNHDGCTCGAPPPRDPTH